MGGSDQWGNIVTGTELIRRKTGGEAFAFTCPLIKKADGGKFGKTEKGNIWLDANKTSPYQFYQFWLNASDSDAATWIKIFTFLPEAEINSLIVAHNLNPADRVLQKKLAEELTKFVHGDAELEKAKETTEKLFSNAKASVDSLSVEDLESIEGIVKTNYSSEKINKSVDILSLLAENSIFESKGAARKMLQNGGVSINREKITDLQMMVEKKHLLHGKFILMQVGKKNNFLITIE
jgi:tyrosyl-tRNA synthetase